MASLSALLGGAAGGALSKFEENQKQRQAKKDFRRARSQAFGTIAGLENEPALGAARTSIIGDINQTEGIDEGSQRQILSGLRGQVAGQQVGQVRGLNEDLARRGLLGGSTELSNRQAISRQAIASLAGGQQQLKLESQREKSRKQALARNQALSLTGVRQGNVAAGSGQLSALTGGLARLQTAVRPQAGQTAQSAQGGAALASKIFGGP